MSGRRSIGGGCLLILVALAIAFFFLTYNVTTQIKYPLPTLVPDHDGVRPSRVDPVVQTRYQDLSPRMRRDPRFHVAVTATEVPYSRWQCRIMYYWYLKVKDGPGSEMGGFTRILHSGRPDSLMEEIPTFVVDPLPHGLDKDYVVLNRPWAFVQWLERATIEEDYVLMGEPDHIFVKPLPNLAYGGKPAAFHFTYIKPVEYENVVRKFYPQDKGPISNVDPIGSSPVIISKTLLKEIAPTWKEIALRIRNDPEANTAFGWVQEMYAYAIASALHGVKHNIHKDFMIQPPWDKKVGRSYIIHYTYASDFTMKGEWTDAKRGDWHFDKRLHQDSPIPKNITLPPRGTPESVVILIKKLNEATASIPRWENS